MSRAVGGDVGLADDRGAGHRPGAARPPPHPELVQPERLADRTLPPLPLHVSQGGDTGRDDRRDPHLCRSRADRDVVDHHRRPVRIEVGGEPDRLGDTGRDSDDNGDGFAGSDRDAGGEFPHPVGSFRRDELQRPGTMQWMLCRTGHDRRPDDNCEPGRVPKRVRAGRLVRGEQVPRLHRELHRRHRAVGDRGGVHRVVRQFAGPDSVRGDLVGGHRVVLDRCSVDTVGAGRGQRQVEHRRLGRAGQVGGGSAGADRADGQHRRVAGDVDRTDGDAVADAGVGPVDGLVVVRPVVDDAAVGVGRDRRGGDGVDVEKVGDLGAAGARRPDRQRRAGDDTAAAGEGEVCRRCAVHVAGHRCSSVVGGGG